jgi:hypothetical protein
MRSTRSILSLISLVLVLNSCLILCEVRFVYEMFRHGARGPGNLDSEGKDLYGEEWNGNMELTEIGMRQHFLLGYRNRLRYKEFLSESYDPREIHIESTDTNRTIMSVYSQLQGLFPPGTGSRLTDAQAIIAIPPLQNDFSQEIKFLGSGALMNYTSVLPVHVGGDSLNIERYSKCTGYKEQRARNIKEQQAYFDFRDKFINDYGVRISNVIKKDIKWLETESHMNDLFDTFIADYTEQKELKAFKNSTINLEEFQNLTIQWLNMSQFVLNWGTQNNSDHMSRIAFYNAFQDIVNWMERRIEMDSKGDGYTGYYSPKLAMYSAHDTNLAGVLTYLKHVFKIPQLFYTYYASSFIIELSRPDNSTREEDYVVTALFNDHTLFVVSFNIFRNMVHESRVSDAEIEDVCQYKRQQMQSMEQLLNSTPAKTAAENYFFFKLMILSIFVNIILIGAIIYLMNKKKSLYNRGRKKDKNFSFLVTNKDIVDIVDH